MSKLSGGGLSPRQFALFDIQLRAEELNFPGTEVTGINLNPDLNRDAPVRLLD
jgi:hypothetical protein